MSKSISLKELAKLLKDCKNNGVSTLKYGDIYISMDRPEKLPMTPLPQARGSAKKAQIISEGSSLQMQFDEAKEIAETLHVEDPAAFERMLIDGELGESKEN